MNAKKSYIKEKLEHNGFHVIDCSDVSEQHIGHNAHAQESHFNIQLKGSFHSPQERLLAHKKALGLFADEIPHSIHALSIKFIP